MLKVEEIFPIPNSDGGMEIMPPMAKPCLFIDFWEVVIVKFNQIVFPKDTMFLITGGAGFIGSNLAQAVIEKGYRARVLDNFSTGKVENIKEIIEKDTFELVTGDIRDRNTCCKACEGVDYVLHHAALGSVPASIDNPALCNEINITGTLNMLIAARDAGVKRFVYASSSAVYGDEPSDEKVEERLGLQLSPYATSKRVNELYARNFFDLFHLQTVGLRYFNVFGKRQDPNSAYAAVIPIFIDKLLQGKAPTIFGDGNQTRDFVHIENIITANLRACIAPEAACGEVYNIGCGSKMTLNDLYSTISDILQRSISPRYEPERVGDIRHSRAKIDKARSVLGFSPEVDINQGLQSSVDWYRIA